MSHMSAALTKKDAPAPYQQSVDALLALLCTDAKRGLSANEARTRLQRDGRNELTVEEPAPGWKKFLAQFKGVLVILLVIATLISFALWLVERETPLPYEAIAIFNFNEWAPPEGPVEREMIERGALTKEEVHKGQHRLARSGVDQSGVLSDSRT